MKRLIHILFLAFLMASCTSPVETRQGTSLPNDGVRETQNLASLQAIDSLMWRQPDSALVVMQGFAGSTEADSLDVFEGHYCQVLISELLYKNDCGQSNRAELLQAVGYFDSIVGTDGADARGASPQRGASLRERDAFLDARAHYINGVGFYEQGDMIDACAEYLKALEVMEGRFDEKVLVKNKAKFMAYTYNRLGDMFSGQFMMESAITCYENALAYCRIETTSPTGVSNTLTRLGLQYEQLKDTEKMRACYSQALEEMPDSDNISYRDMVASKALCDYKVDSDAEQSLETLRHILSQAEDEDERLTRYLTIGAIFCQEKMYDSAVAYLEPVFENTRDDVAQIQAAEHLHSIYESLDDDVKSNECMRFLVNHKKSEGESKALTSQLEDMFKTYQNQKQEKESEKEREKSIRKTIGIIVPIALAIALAIIVMAKRRSWKLLLQQQEEADRVLGETEQAHGEELRRLQAETKLRLEEAEKRYRHKVEEMEQTKQRHEAELEAERLAYEKEREALMQSLRQQEDQMKALEKSLSQQQDKEEVWRRDFLKEPICQRIYELLHGKQITSRDVSNQHKIALNEDDLRQLKEAVERHYAGFDNVLLSHGDLKRNDLTLCHLHLLGLSQGEIGALRGVTYSGVRKQDESLQRKFRTKEEIESYVLGIAEVLLGTQDGTQTTESDEQDLDAWIVKQITDNPKITTEKLAEKSHKGVRTIKRHIADMDHVRYVGSGYSGHWEVIK